MVCFISFGILVFLFVKKEANEIKTFRYFNIGYCSIEFYSSKESINLPLNSVEILYANESKRLICKVKYKIRNFILQSSINRNYHSFQCQNKNFHMNNNHLEIIKHAIILCYGNNSKSSVRNEMNSILVLMNNVKSYLKFNLPIIDMIIGISKQYHLITALYNNRFIASIFSSIDDFINQINNNKALPFESDNFRHMKLKMQKTIKNKNVYNLINEILYIRYITNKPTSFYYFIANISGNVFYLFLSNEKSSPIMLYDIIIKKNSINEKIQCSIWNKNENSNEKSNCNITKINNSWTSCQCNKTGIVIIKKLKQLKTVMKQFDFLDFYPPNLTPEVKMINFDLILFFEDMYRYERLISILNLAIVSLSLINIFSISMMMLYYRFYWSTISYSNRHYVCLLILLWLNVLLLPSFVIRLIRIYLVLPTPNTEYIATGVVVIHSIFTYTLMLGGCELILFVFVTNLRLWTSRYFDTFHFLVIICCFSIPLLFVFTLYKIIVISVHKFNLLPIGYGAVYFVIGPIIFVFFLSLVLTGVSMFYPNRGGGNTIMFAIYPLIILHGVNYYQIMRIKNIFDFDHVKIFYYSCGSFMQVVYHLILFIILSILPVKNLTIFGKTDAPFKHEYIYLIKFQNRKEIAVPSTTTS